MIENVDFLKKVLSIPTKSFKEDLMIEFLVEYLTEKKHNFQVDDFGNVYVTKGVLDEGESYPCIVGTKSLYNPATPCPSISVGDPWLVESQPPYQSSAITH